MSSYLQINQSIHRAFEDQRLLTSTETLEVLEHLENISEENVLLNNLLSHVMYVRDCSTNHAELTKRELQILKLIGCNFKSRDISKALDISKYTVATHRKNIIKKLGITGTRQLKVYATEHVKKQIT